MESPLRQGGGRPGLRLIETMRWDGRALALWPRHLARLGAGARALGWAAPDAVRVDAALSDLPPTPARVRMTLDAAGHVAVEVAPLPEPRAPWRLGLAAARLSSADPWLTVKSTERAIYEAARASLAPGLDEVVLANERNEVCDGTITTLFFDRGQGLRTPPLTSGLLPGVLRAELLATGRATEQVLRVEDLPRVRLWVGNALRGLTPAVWAG